MSDTQRWLPKPRLGYGLVTWCDIQERYLLYVAQDYWGGMAWVNYGAGALCNRFSRPRPYVEIKLHPGGMP